MKNLLSEIEKEQTDISLELVGMLFEMMTTKKRKQTFYVNKISEKIQKIIDKKVKERSEQRELLKDE